MGRTEFPQRTSWDKLNSPRTTSCARPGTGKIVMKTMIKSARTTVKLPRTRFTLRLLEFISVGDGVVCSHVLNRVNLARAEHRSSEGARSNRKETASLLSQASCGKSNRQNLSAI